jgi:hypothetical protein
MLQLHVLVQGSFRTVGLMAVIDWALEKPCNLSCCPSVPFAFIFEANLSLLQLSLLFNIRVLPMGSHALLVLTAIIGLVHASQALAVRNNSCSTLVSVDYLLTV